MKEVLKHKKIVTASESVDDVYIGHVNTPTHLMIASEQCLWTIDRHTRQPLCLSWDEISHIIMRKDSSVQVSVFSQTGVRSFVYKVGTMSNFVDFYHILTMQVGKVGKFSSNTSNLERSMLNYDLENISEQNLPGIKAKQKAHVFGSFNGRWKSLKAVTKDDIDLIEQCFERVKHLESESTTFFKSLDEETWMLVKSWGQVHSGLSSRRCLAAGIINGSGHDIQIKSSILVEGGSPCYSIPSKEFDQEQGVLHPGGAIIFFCWGALPSLTQSGNIFMHIETNAFVSDFSARKSKETIAMALPGFQVGFLEKSYDEKKWWAKYWILVRKA